MNRKLLLSTGLMGGSLVLCSAVLAGRLDASSAPTLSFRDRAIIEEVYNLWSSVADDIWPGASAIKIPIVYLKEQYEYAIGFPASLEGFTDSGETIQRGRNVQVRKRKLGRDLSASFPFDGFPAVEIGSPEALGKALGEWVITAGHEMFHVFQAAKGGYEKTAALEIGPPNDSSWHLNFPFPYSDSDVMRLIHLQGYLVWLASVSPDVDEGKYIVGTALDAVQVYRSCSATSRPTERPTDTLSTQEWTEGVAAYTEYRLAQRAAQDGYRPTQAYSSVPGFQNYKALWRQVYEARPFLAKHAGRAAKSRTAFYHLGMGKALALDRVSPNWKEKYFAPSVWLDDLLVNAIGNAP